MVCITSIFTVVSHVHGFLLALQVIDVITAQMIKMIHFSEKQFNYAEGSRPFCFIDTPNL